ncbi:SHC-transforming protein 2 [Sphaerodactylus townsendi]|uniref:SHC-transforming protein 2 n=1 Tax=Sphaerodactylus townsendi TaxID=933632 RepID=UPI002026871F|nr:SHC-transforming protein 2 [Sphaerodactylus townsendi]
MLTEPKYDRFQNGSLTSSEKPAMSSKVAAATPSPPPPATALAHPCPPPLGDEQEAVTTFCMLIPKMPQWKFSSPSGFLSRSPSSASKELSASAKTGSPGEAGTGSGSPSSSSGLAAVLSACEPVCAAPCSLQVMSRLRGGARGGRKAPPAEGAKLARDEWSRKGSFISKPVQGWLHPDERVLGPGVSYIVRYMGCIEILRSMRSLDFNTRTQVTKEAINRLYEAVPGVKGTWKKKAPNKALFSILGKSNLRFAGISIVVNISINGLNLMIPTTRQGCSAPRGLGCSELWGSFSALPTGRLTFPAPHALILLGSGISSSWKGWIVLCDGGKLLAGPALLVGHCRD